MPLHAMLHFCSGIIINNKKESRGNQKMLCPKCKKEYSGHPAISRITGENICPMCGSNEAMDIAGWSESKKNEATQILLYNLNSDLKSQ